RQLSENRGKLVLLGIHLAIDGAQDVVGIGSGDVGSQGPVEGEFVAPLAGQVPVVHFLEQAVDGAVSLFLGGVGQHDQELVSALAEREVGAAEDGFEYLGKL